MKILLQKSYVFWTLVFLAFFTIILNLFISFTMLYTLRIGLSMESLEQLPSKNALKFFGITDLDNVWTDHAILGFQNLPLRMAAQEFQLNIDGNVHSIAPNGIIFRKIKEFTVAHDERIVFSMDFASLPIPRGGGVTHLEATKLFIPHLVYSQELALKSDTFARMRGNQGVEIRGIGLNVTADGDINLNSVRGGMRFIGDVYFDTDRMIVSYGRYVPQFKLCACMPGGFLFKVPVPRHVKGHLACAYYASRAVNICDDSK